MNIFTKSVNGTSPSSSNATISSMVGFKIIKDTTINGNVYVGGSLFTNNVAIETVLTNFANNISVSSNNPVNTEQLTLSPGTWILNNNVYCGGTPSEYMVFSISPTSNTPDSNSLMRVLDVSLAWEGANLTRIVKITSTTTYYGVFAFETSGISSITGYLSAVKIA